MPVPVTIAELDPTAGNNYPSGSDSPSTIDNYLRAHAAFIAQLRDADETFYTQSEVNALIAAAGPQPGDMKDWPSSVPPSGWLARNGAAVSRTTYAALFAVIGTTFGAGDGVTTFNLPNSVNRVTVGAGGLYAVGATGGSKDASVIAHTHTGTTVSAGTHSHTLPGQYLQNNAAGGGIASGSGVGFGTATDAAGAHSHTFTTDSTGSSGTDANMQPYIAMLPIIKF